MEANKSSKQITNLVRLKGIVKLLRPHQYYKNVLIFFGLFFSRNIFRIDTWIPILFGFIALCIISSLNYIINDFRDREKDKSHPEKKDRPFPSGTISIPMGIFLMILLLITAIVLVYFIPDTHTPIQLIPTLSEEDDYEPAQVTVDSKMAFILVLGALFFTSQIYSFFLREFVFLDVITISVNYVWRAVAGVVLISVTISPWLIILCFTSAMLLALAKRKGDMAMLGENAKEHKRVFRLYTEDLIDQSLATIIAVELLAIFIYLNERHPNETVFIILSLPLFTFILFRYLFLVSNKGEISRKAEKLFFDKQLIITGLIIVLLFFFAIYFPNFLDNLIGLPPDR